MCNATPRDAEEEDEHAQRFLIPFSAVSNHFRPRRHRVTASAYRHCPVQAANASHDNYPSAQMVSAAHRRDPEICSATDFSAVWRVVRGYAEVAGLIGVKPHDFRRFVGTQLAAGDIRKAQKALGHKRIDTTARHYVLDELQPGLTDDLY